MGKFAVILPAAGRSTRFGDPKQKKIYAELEGRAVWLRAVEPFVNRDDVIQIVIAIAAEDRELFERRYRASVAFMNIKVIEGGPERSDTVACALEILDPACEYICVHDAARPCLSPSLIDAVFESARAHGAALLAGGSTGFLGLTEAATTVFPTRPVTEDEARALTYGQRIPVTGTPGLHAAVDPHGRLYALVEDAGSSARVTVGFPPS